MLKRTLSGLAAIAICATSAAAAYTPGPLPESTFGGGYVPPDALVLKDEQKAHTAGAGHAVKAANCYAKGVSNVANGKPDGVATCLSTANAVYEGKLAKLLYLPDCHDYAADDDVINAIVKAFNPGVYCDSPSGAFIDTATF